MPLIKPEIQKALRSAGLASQLDDHDSSDNDKSPFENQLERAGLGLEDTLNELANISKTSVSEHLKLRSIETVLKLHQVLKESPATQIPQINIIINDSSSSALINDVNPIFLPRQLLTTLANSETALRNDQLNLKNQGGSLRDSESFNLIDPLLNI